jgi:ankyrin repeat protein
VACVICCHSYKKMTTETTAVTRVNTAATASLKNCFTAGTTAIASMTVLPETVIRPLIDWYIQSEFARLAHEPDPEGGQTPLVEAAERGDEASVFMILQHVTRNLVGHGALQRYHVNANYDSWHNLTALHMAAIHGHEAIAHLLLQLQEEEGEIKEGKDGKLYDQYCDTPPYWKDHDCEMTQPKALAVGPTWALRANSSTTSSRRSRLTDIERPDCVGWTPLVHAMVHGQYTIALLLLQHGAQYLHWKDDAGRTMLHLAAQEGHTALVMLLLEQEQDGDHRGMEPMIQARDIKGWTALHYALAGYTNHHNNKKTPTNTMDCATTNVRYQLVQLLLHHGASVNAPNDSHQTALHLAVHAEMNRIPNTKSTTSRLVVQLLLDHGANVHAVNNRGRTALHLAAMDGRLWPLLSTLLQHGACVNAKDDDDCTALHIALRNIMAVPPPLMPMPERTSRSDNCVAEEGVILVELLLRYGANVTLVDEIGRTPLFHATTGHKDIYVRLLLEAHQQQQQLQEDTTCCASSGIINAQDCQGRTPLHNAVRRGEETIVRLLLQYQCPSCGAGVNRNLADRSGWTALHFSADIGNYSLTQQLLLVTITSGGAAVAADPSLCNRNGHKPLDIAMSRGFHSVAQLLQQQILSTFSTTTTNDAAAQRE